MPFDDLVTFDPKVPKEKPYLTKILIFLICFMFLIEILFNALYSDKALIILGAKWNEGITHGEYWRFLTCTFLHGHLMHLVVNVAAIYIFGQEVESLYGSFKFLLIYLLSSWGASLSSYTFSTGISVGASGAVFGIIGSLVVFFFMQREKVTGAELKFKSMYTLVIMNLALGFLLPRIDNYAHIGGLLTGSIFAYFIYPEYVIEKNEASNKLAVIKKPHTIRNILGVVFLTILLTWLTKLTVNLHK